jgi:peptidoglycan hydrolase-like protein with peptidoglycan-binding domain
MNRTLTAAVALAAGLGMAGLAQAQMNGTTPTNPSMGPSTTTSPGMTGTTSNQNPQTMSAPSATGSYSTQPQANSQPQMNANMQRASVSQEEIQQAQQQLKSQGLYRGAVDGKMGRGTETAIMAFQRKQGLPETAQLDQQTLSALSGGGQQQPGSPSTQGMTPSYQGTQSPATQNPAGSTGGSTTMGTTPGGTQNR